jgi:class 3 adenylate cyclase
MAKILLVDDDELSLDSMGTFLRMAGYEVVEASDGVRGLQAAISHQPDLILLDVRMPVLDGFGMLAALRANAATKVIPCVLLTALDDRECLDNALRYGADGVLLKPARAEALLQSIAGRLEVLGARTHVGMRAVRVPRAPKEAMSNEEELDAVLVESSTRAPFKEVRNVSVLFSDIRNFSTMAELLTASEVAELLQRYYERAVKVIRRHNGMLVRIIGDAMLVAFDSQGNVASEHAGDALRAGLLLQVEARNYAAELLQRYPGRNLPEFAVGTGIHTGEVMVCGMGPGQTSEITIIGDTVNVAARLEALSKEHNCRVIASASAADIADGKFVCGERRSVSLKGRRAPIEVVEVTDFQPRVGEVSPSEHAAAPRQGPLVLVSGSRA